MHLRHTVHYSLPSSIRRRSFLAGLTQQVGIVLAGSSLTGCGTILHPERQGRPHSHQIDWRVAALNGLGLLFFFVPGVIAFVVDFATGAIYLPVEETYPHYGAGPALPIVPPSGYEQSVPAYPTAAPPTSAPPPAAAPLPEQLQQLGLKRVLVPRDDLAAPRIQQVVRDHVGQEIALDHPATHVQPLSSLQQFIAAIRPTPKNDV